MDFSRMRHSEWIMAPTVSTVVPNNSRMRNGHFPECGIRNAELKLFFHSPQRRFDVVVSIYILYHGTVLYDDLIGPFFYPGKNGSRVMAKIYSAVPISL